MTKQELVNQFPASKTFLDKSTDVLTEEDSSITPVEGMMTAAQQIAHIAQTVYTRLAGKVPSVPYM